jgi:hypothetical protein
MRRWQLTAVLVVLAGAGVTLAAGVPAGVVAIDRGRSLAAALWESVVLTRHDDLRREPVAQPETLPEAAPFGRDPSPPPTTIPELSEPLRPARPVITVLPPDPAPVHYGCGGRPVPADQPVPACGMG